MFEKVNPMHPDKIADRIAGAIVDLAYSKEVNPKVAVEVLIGHGKCTIINETSCKQDLKEIKKVVKRISGITKVSYTEVAQDEHLAKNQEKEFRCGDNGIFKGVPITLEQANLILIARDLSAKYKSDGKYIINKNEYVICQSNAKSALIKSRFIGDAKVKVNPLGEWTGGTDVDTGATNRKLGSDMGDGITGGGLHGKDLSKADVSVNIACFIFAQRHKCTVQASCAIGDEEIVFETDGKIKTFTMKYEDVVYMARNYIAKVGGFEKFAEWGLIR